MAEAQFKSLCRLNRLLILALAALTLASLWPLQGWWDKVLIAGLMAGHLVALMGNEFFLKMVKRLREAELETVTHISVFGPVMFSLYVGLTYLFTGSFPIYLFGIFGVLQAQFLGQPRLSRAIGLFAVTMLMLGMPFGLPKAFSLTPTQMFFATLIWGGCLYYYGAMVSRMVRTHTSEVGKLQSMAATDALTGLTNRRQFNTRLLEEVARARRYETPLTLALFDIDDFKRLNDFYGHQVGDRILRELGKQIRQNIRESDLAARYGGEEFALVLSETRETEAYELLERIRLMIAQNVFCLPENPLTITVSVGVAQLNPRQQTAFELVELADKALYEAKKQGKNQVIRASSLMHKVLIDKRDTGLPFFKS